MKNCIKSKSDFYWPYIVLFSWLPVTSGDLGISHVTWWRRKQSHRLLSWLPVALYMTMINVTLCACVVANCHKEVPQGWAYNIRHKYKGQLFHCAIEHKGYHFSTSGCAVTFRTWGLVERLTSGCMVTSGGLGSDFRLWSHFRWTREWLPVVKSLPVARSLPVDWELVTR